MIKFINPEENVWFVVNDCNGHVLGIDDYFWPSKESVNWVSFTSRQAAINKYIHIYGSLESDIYDDKVVCVWCNSDIYTNLEYSDTKVIPYSIKTERSIRCPKCRNKLYINIYVSYSTTTDNIPYEKRY